LVWFVVGLVCRLLCLVHFGFIVETMEVPPPYTEILYQYSFFLIVFVSRLMSIRDFYSRILRIDDARLRQMDWSASAGAPDSRAAPRVALISQSLHLDITNRIMRVDNYVIAMVNKGSAADSAVGCQVDWRLAAARHQCARDCVSRRRVADSHALCGFVLCDARRLP
jgi:hypothetical protein